MVVDDDENIRKVLAHWVAEAGHTVKVAADADAALKMLDDEPVDVAVCDIRMPGHDGIWLMDRIRTQHPDVAVVVATGLMEMDPLVTLRPGVVGYIVKPFGKRDVADMVQLGLMEHARLSTSTRAADSGELHDALDHIELTSPSVN
jgi:DNA-binding NtrC family response regulator